MKVIIKEWNAVASWRWDMPEEDVCGICRVQFDGTCPTCKYPGDDCALCMYSASMEPIFWLMQLSDRNLWSFLPYGIGTLEIDGTHILIAPALSPHLDTARLIERPMSDVQTE